MDAFIVRLGAETQFPTAKKVIDSIRLQMRTMTRRCLRKLNFEPKLATAFAVQKCFRIAPKKTPRFSESERR